jgi:Carboxymuconolactone decarboxylase family
MERLRRLAVSDAGFAEDRLGGGSVDFPGLDAKTLELVRLAALVAVGGAVPSYGAQADAAVNAGATAAEICGRVGWRGSHRWAALRCCGGTEARAGAGV